MLLSAGDEVAACDVCGAPAVAAPATWCGGCGALLATGRATPAAHPTPPGPPPVPARPVVPRHRTTIAAVTLTLLGVLVASVIAVGDEVAAPPSDPTWVPLAGRADDLTGRSSTGPPLPGLVQRWSAAAAPSDAWSVYELPTIGFGDGLVAIGDRLVRVADGAVLGSSDVALAGAWESPTPDGLVALAERGELRLLDPVDGAVVDRVPVPGLETDGRVVDWVGDLAIVDVFDDGPGLVMGIDRVSGEVRWRFRGQVWAALDDRWAIGWRRDTESDGSDVLLDVATGDIAALPGDLAGRLAGIPVVDRGRIVAPLADEVVAWEPTTGEVLWRAATAGTTRGSALAVADGRVLLVEGAWGGGGLRLTSMDAATGAVIGDPRDVGGAPTLPMSAQVAVGDGRVVRATPTGLRWIAVDGTAPVDVVVPELLAIAAVDAGDSSFVAISGTLAPNERSDQGPPDRIVGDATAILFDARGTELSRASVRPVALGPGYRFGSVLDGRVAVTPSVAAPGYADVRFVDVDDGDVVPAGVGLARFVGRVRGPAEAFVVGAVAGGPGPGGLSPLVWQRSPHAIVVRDGVVELDGSVPADGRPPVVADGVLAVPVADGMLLQPLPEAGEGLAVDRAVGTAVGATTARAAVRSAVADRPSVLVEGLEPVAGAGDLLLAGAPVPGPVAAGAGVGGAGVGGAGVVGAGVVETGLATLVAVDPTTGEERWRSDLEVRLDDEDLDPLGALPALSATATPLHDGRGGPVVVDTGHEIVALAHATGETLWRATATTPRRPGAALVGGRVVVATTAGAEAFDVDTGASVWAADVGDLVTALGAAGRTTLLGTAAGEVVVLDRAGAVADRLSGPGGRVDDVAVVDGWVLAVHYDGAVVAFGPRPTTIDRGDEVGVPGPSAVRSPSSTDSR